MMSGSIQSLQRAIKVGNIERVKSLVKAGVDVNTPLDYNERVIMNAACRGNLEIVKILVEAGAEVSAWSEGETAIMLAACNAKRDVYDYLYPLLDDYTRQYVDKYGEITIRNSSLRKKRLAKKDVEQFIQDALFGNVDRVKQWIRKGIDVNAIGSDGKTALMYAARNYSIPVVETLLLDGNANPDIINYYKDDGEGEGKSALMYAADEDINYDSKYYQKLFQLFKKSQANLDLQGEGGSTALMLAAGNGQINTVKELINIGVNLDLKDNNNNTALMLALSRFEPESAYDSIDRLLKKYNRVKPKYVKVIEFLRDKGASQAGLENIALINAVEKGNLKEIKALINTGADVNHRCQSTALCRASSLGHTEIVKVLIDVDADVDKRGSQGHFNPLLNAAYAGHLEVVKILVEAGANINLRVTDYLNSLEYAELGFSTTKDFNERMRYLDIIEILENAGATREYFN